MQNIKTPSQCQLIKEALEQGDRLTGMQILNRFGCLNYKGRIADLRKKHQLPIKTDMVRTPTGKRIGVYYIQRSAI
jgi:hypothetical protein